MDNPKTQMVCDLCKEEFLMEMQRSRRGGWEIPNASIIAYSGDDDIFDVDVVCRECEDKIISALQTCADNLKKKDEGLSVVPA